MRNNHFVRYTLSSAYGVNGAAAMNLQSEGVRSVWLPRHTQAAPLQSHFLQFLKFFFSSELSLHPRRDFIKS